MYRENWRSCKEWKDEGLALTTTSDEAAKLFDVAVTQSVTFRDFDSTGGVFETLESLKRADPDFVLGRLLNNVSSLLWATFIPTKDTKYKDEIELTLDLADNSTNLTPRERSHVNALKLLYDSFVPLKKVCDVWEDILNDHPTDMMALKFLQDACILSGDKMTMRASIERAFVKWNSSMPLYSYLFGMKAFALGENGEYAMAEVIAKQGVEMNPTDVWCTHALAHAYEMTGQFDAGEKFLEGNVNFWEPRNTLAGHVHWHNALYSVEKGDYAKALEILDKKVAHTSTFEMIDSCALLFRLQMEGVEVRDRFDRLYEMCLDHSDDHLMTFGDLHCLMAILGSCHRSEGEKFLQNLKEQISDSTCSIDYANISASVGIPVFEGMLAYDGGCYARAVDLIRPVEHEIVRIGGSDAQRDLFSQLLINAAIQSDDPGHQQLAENLLKKRKYFKQNSPLTDRLILKLSQVRRSK